MGRGFGGGRGGRVVSSRNKFTRVVTRGGGGMGGCGGKLFTRTNSRGWVDGHAGWGGDGGRGGISFIELLFSTTLLYYTHIKPFKAISINQIECYRKAHSTEPYHHRNSPRLWNHAEPKRTVKVIRLI